MPEIEGGAEIRIRPDVSGFEAALRSQLQPILSRVEGQLVPLFRRAGQSSGAAFSQEFSRSVQASLGTALSSAAGGRGVAEAGKQTAQQFGAGLTREIPTQITKGVGDGVKRAASSTEAAVKNAGTQSGRVFGSGFGEGFAALAAFAIAARVKRFFSDTVAQAGEFADAFAAVRKNVAGTPEQFASLETSIKGMAEQFGFSAASIAETASEMAKLGVPVGNLSDATEVVNKLAIALDISAVEAGKSLTLIAAFTKTPIEQLSNLGSTVAQLEAVIGVASPRILDFATRTASSLRTLGLTAPQVLGISAAFARFNVPIESASRGITQAISQMQLAAKQGGTQLESFLKITGLTADTFQELAQADPAQLFVKFLQGLSEAGAELPLVLNEVDIGTRRVVENLRIGAGQFGTVAAAIDEANRAFTANTRIEKEFAERQKSSADQLRRLQQEFQNTRIELGAKLAPALIAVQKPFAALTTGTVGLVAAFAGVAAAGFAFVRFSNILREFSKTLGGGALTADEFAIGQKIAAERGLQLSTVMKAVTAEGKSLTQAQALLINQDPAMTAALGKQTTGALNLASAYRAAKQSLTEFNLAQTSPGRGVPAGILAETQLKASQQIIAASLGPALQTQTVAFKASTDAIILETNAKLREAESSIIAEGGIRRVTNALRDQITLSAQAGRVAVTAAGGFGALTKALGQGALFLIVADFLTQAKESLTEFLDVLVRGQSDIQSVTNTLLGLQTRVQTASDVFDAARLDVSGLDQTFLDLSEAIGNPIGQVLALTDTIERIGIPGLSNLAGAAGNVLTGINDLAGGLAEKIPIIGGVLDKIFVTSTEKAEERFKDLSEGLEKVLGSLGPRVAGQLFKTLQSFAAERGGLDSFNKGLDTFSTKLREAQESQAFVASHAQEIITKLREQGATQEEVAASAQLMGLSEEQAGVSFASVITGSDAATAALSRLNDAQQQFQSRVRTLISPVSALISAQQKLQKTAGKGAKDTLSAARAIADAERALAEARKDAAKRIADATRRLAEAEIDAIRRVLDARRQLEESRLDSTRSLRDATQNLQDFQRSLEQVGGPRTEEDFIRLRELQEALADATEDAASKEVEGRRKVQDAQREGNEAILEATRRLAEAQEESADRIADALRRLARAHEDAAKRSETAQSRIEKAVVLSTAQITKGFQQQADKLNTFTDLMTRLQTRVEKIFGDTNLSDAFLSDLNEMGVEAIPILKNLVGSSDKQLKGLSTAFTNQIKAAKKAADLQFNKFPPNFKEAIAPAIDNIFAEMERGIGAFDILGDKSGDMATEISGNLGNLTLEFEKLVIESGVQLTKVEQKFLDLAESTTDPTTRVAALKRLIESLRSRTLDINARVTGLERVRELALLQGQLGSKVTPLRSFLAESGQSISIALDDRAGALGTKENPMYVHGLGGAQFGATVSGPFAQVPKAQFGSNVQSGQPILVGRHSAEELFTPNSGGAIFSHTNTERILRALRVSRRSGNTYIQVNQVAEDPLATARKVSFLQGSNGAVR